MSEKNGAIEPEPEPVVEPARFPNCELVVATCDRVVTRSGRALGSRAGSGSGSATGSKTFSRHTPTEPIGVYVHFPWCLRKCPYCDFASFERERAAIDHHGYADAIVAELGLRGPDLGGRRLETVFFGGGTPSLWEPSALGRVLEAIVSGARSRAQQIEVTVECNPTSLDRSRAEALLDVGVNRLSLGVQSLDQARLQFLGRLHDPAQAIAAVEAAVRVMPRVSADLIFGVAAGSAGRQSPREAASEARQVAELGVGHVSAYALTIEPNTRFGELSRQRRLPLLGDALVADSFCAVANALSELGFEHYEISNYARPGERSRHNLAYWRGHDYLGLGAAAFGALATSGGAARRYRNPPNPDTYLRSVARGLLEPHEIDELDPETRMRERLMLGLRLAEGLDLETAARELGVAPWSRTRRRAARELARTGRLSIEGPRLVIPRDAWLFADGTAARLF